MAAPYEIIFHYPRPSALDENGVLHVHASGYTNEVHRSGSVEIKPDNPDYGIWLWMAKQPVRFDGVKSDQLDQVRREYAAENSDQPSTHF